MDSRESYSWILRPFSTCVDIFKDEDVLAKVEFLGLRENNSLKVDFQNDKLGTFWRKAAAEYPIIADRALKMLIPFATTYRCETGFSTLVTLKTKARNRLNVEHDMRWVVTLKRLGTTALEAAERHAGVSNSNGVRVAQPGADGASGASAVVVNSTDGGYNDSGAGGSDSAPRIPLENNLKHRLCTGETVRSLGFITARVSSERRRAPAAACPRSRGRPPLLGRSWMREKPIFCKARPLPLALRVPVEKELERMKREGTIIKVEISEYGTPMVPVIKKCGNIRICRYYKITLNPRLKRDPYPLPRVVFAALSGGKLFSKIDLTNATRTSGTDAQSWSKPQWPPSEDITQKDDIFITGRDVDEHIDNLRAVLTRLYNAGLRIKLSNQRVLAHYDARLRLVLSVAAARTAGAALGHRPGGERPASYASRTLNDADKSHSQLDTETLAIFHGVTTNHRYLYGRHFIIRTDHKSLSHIFGNKLGIPQTAASHLQRYAARLTAYDYSVEWVSTAENSGADALSCLPLSSDTLAKRVSGDGNFRTKAARADGRDAPEYRVTYIRYTG
ncbi:Protein ZBED8 [Eumeta japonica]|uniref:Protein ZBED8 n=1 Tax=Eumeta variegata TaxID=151549 RepID=A0A4C1ZXI8_EUMVA|nr:Protein ZBED8 [Eumeta japonica]